MSAELKTLQAKRLLREFAGLWKGRYGRAYPIAWTKETSQISRLLDTYEAGELILLLRYFLADFRDSFADRAGHSLSSFVGCLPSVIAGYQKQSLLSKPTNHEDLDAIKLARERLRDDEGDW